MSINRTPLGLLGFLGIKNSGQYPQRLTGELVPTWDLAQLYLNASAQYAQVVTTVNATGYVPLFAVPNNETWWVTDYSMDIATGAAESWQGTIGRATPNNISQVRLRDERTLAASTWAVLAAPVTDHLICSPGENLGVLTNAVVGTIDVVAQVRYVVLSS